ncbi:MAG: mammalian cell entry protein [Frankiales bacterium]|nr:mammalian cell entry protein [Frankiales bacterium]
MITRQTRLQLLVFLLISVAGLSYTGIRYAGLGKFFLDQGYVVSAEFVDSGGIFKGAEVTYRGVAAGKVEQLDLIDGGVRVDLRLRPGTEVPDDVRALVANRSAVGEQFVDLQPQRQGEPFMEPGDVIPVSRTAIPISPTQLVVNLDDLVRSIDTTDLGIVLDELGKAFGNGTGDSLQKLVDQGDVLTRAALDALPETKALIRDGNTVLDTQRDVAGQFESFNSDLATLTQTLRTSDADFRALYANGTQSATELTDLIRKNETDLPVLLSNLVTVAQIQKVRLPAIKQILVTYPNVVAGGFTVAPGDGTTHFGLVLDSAPPVCTRGYETTQKRPPADTGLRTPNLNAYCAEPRGSASNVRGARNAQYPTGERPFPEGRQAQASGTSGAGSRVPGFAAGEPDTVRLGDYDPATGKVITEDGERLSIGTSSGAQRVFGADSWQWLLLGPLSQ